MDISLSNVSELAFQQLYLSVIGTLVGGIVGFALAVWVRRRPRWASVLIGLAEVIQTIPGIALLAFLLLAFGLGDTTLIVGLGLYAILPILQNTYEGLVSVDPVYLGIGTGMGMTPGEIFRQIELPLAFPFILAGLRIALVTSIGVATIGVFVGSGGLGTLIYRGLQLIDIQVILAGAIPAGLLAILLEVGLSLLERKLSQNVKSNT
ncbi:amino acid ABC transporter permease [Ktedonobacteria bacterium brp13]|nr:amino acid ABC transporter permease [Ktedonobacteria bacterium brp13]